MKVSNHIKVVQRVKNTLKTYFAALSQKNEGDTDKILLFISNLGHNGYKGSPVIHVPKFDQIFLSYLRFHSPKPLIFCTIFTDTTKYYREWSSHKIYTPKKKYTFAFHNMYTS